GNSARVARVLLPRTAKLPRSFWITARSAPRPAPRAPRPAPAARPRPARSAQSLALSAAGLGAGWSVARPALEYPGGQLGPGGEAQLGEDVLQVRVDRPLGQVQLLGDLPVAEAVGDQAGDLP